MNEVGVRLKVAASGLENIGALTRELNKAGVETTALDQKADELGAELKKLAQQQALIDQFERTKTVVGAADAAMQAAKVQAGALARQLADAKNAVGLQRAAFEASGAASRTLGADLAAQKERVAQLAVETRRLGTDQGLIEQFKRQKLAVADTATAMQAAKQSAAELGRALAATEAPSRAQQVAFDRARAAARAADDAYTAQRLALQNLRGQMSAAGIASADLASAQVRVRRDTDLASEGLTRAREEVKRLTSQQQAAKDQTGQLAREMKAAEGAIAGQEKAFTKSRTAARDASTAFDAQRLTLQQLRPQLASAGIGGNDLAAAQVRVNRDLEQARSALQATTDWAQRMAAAQRTAASSGTALAGTAQQTAAAVRSQGDAAQVATAKLAGMGDTLGSLARVGVAGILGSQAVQLLKGVTETADGFANLQSRIKLVTGEGPAFNAAMAGIGEIALRTNSNLESTGTLFSRIAQAGKEIGVGQAAALQLTESINQAVQLSGASADASNAAVTQLIQGLQSGALRGDEFNSVMEQAPRLAQALAAGLNVSTGELRKLAEAGQLTSATVIKSLQSQREALEKEFATLPATVGRAIENLNTKWTLFVGSLNSGTGATGVVAKGINGIADNLEALAGIAGRAGTVLVAALAVQGVAALRNLATEMLTTAASAGVLSKQLNEIPKVVNIAVAVTGFEIGYQIGTWLHENTALARKLGVGLASYAQVLVDALVLVKEAVAAVFTSDTVDAALARYQQRTAALRKSFAELYEDAEKSPEVVRAAAQAAADETKKLGDTAEAAGTKVAGAGAAGAAGMGATTQAANDATGAIASLTSAAANAGRVLPGVGQSADQQATALANLALKGRAAAVVFQRELPGAIEKLSGTELDKFRVAMTQALAQAKDEAIKLAAELGNVGPKGAAALARAEQATRLMQRALLEVGAQAAQSLGVDLVGASSRVSKEFVTAETNLSILVSSLPALKRDGVDTATVVAQALAKMLDSAKNQAEIDAVTARFKTLGAQGMITGQQMGGGFDLARDKAKALREKLDELTPGMQSLGDAAKRAGVDVGLLTDGITKGGKENIATVRDLVSEIINTQVSAEKAGPVLAEAFDQRIKAAQTREELMALIAEIIRARGASLDFGGAIGRALDDAKAKAEQLNPVMAALRAEAKRLGVELAGVQGSKPSPSLTNPDGSQQSSNTRAANAGPSGNGIEFYSTTGSTREQRLAGQNAVDASAQYDLLQRSQAGAISAADLPLAQAVVAALLNNSRLESRANPGAISLAGQASRSRDFALAQRAVEQALAAQPQAAAGGGGGGGGGRVVGTPQSVGAAANAAIAASTNVTRTVNINLSGGRSTSVGVSSDADAARLESFLRMLEADSRRAS